MAMTAGDLLRVEPEELQFPFELKKQSSCSLQLCNMTDDYIAFKVKTTNPKKYGARPNTGIVLPRSTCEVIVAMQAQKEMPADMQCKDKFLLLSVVASPGAKPKDIPPEMFNKDSGNRVEESKLRVVYVSPPTVSSLGFEGKRFRFCSEQPTLTAMTAGDLLRVEPEELQFPFELKKQISCSLQLCNMTDDYIAFKVKTTNPNKYCVRPNTGIVLPRSTCEVIVTMQAHEEMPADMQCKDMFLLQSVVASPGAKPKDIPPEMFNKNSGNRVEESMLRVVYVSPPRPPSPVREGSEEGSSPRASFSDNGNVISSEFATGSRSYLDSQDTSAEVRAFLFKLTKEKNSMIQQTNMLRQELEVARHQYRKSSEIIIPFKYVMQIGFIGVILGYFLKNT